MSTVPLCPRLFLVGGATHGRGCDDFLGEKVANAYIVVISILWASCSYAPRTLLRCCHGATRARRKKNDAAPARYGTNVRAATSENTSNPRKNITSLGGSRARDPLGWLSYWAHFAVRNAPAVFVSFFPAPVSAICR